MEPHSSNPSHAALLENAAWVRRLARQLLADTHLADDIAQDAITAALQRPPAFSAVRVGGRRAYKLARRGPPPEIAAREVEVRSIDLVGYSWPMVTLDIHCAKGFYVRSLARDLGRALGAGGHCRSIRRRPI